MTEIPDARPGKDSVLSTTAYSETQAQAYDRLRFESPAGRLIHQRELRCLLRGLGKTSDAPVLEVGCGTGRLLIAACERGYKVDGVDASKPMLDQLHLKISQRWPVNVYLAKADNLPFDSDTFGFVYAIRLLNQTESVAYALKVIEEMCRITRPEGYVLIEFVNHYRPRLGRRAVTTVRLRPRQVVREATRCGCSTVKVRGAFLLSMKAYAYLPAIVLPAWDRLDRIASALLPRLCSRCYVLVQKSI
jgi:ubiquinone/menaquinone biosynthesis C-methylase UbiE